VLKDNKEDDIVNAASKTGLFNMSLGLSNKEQRKRIAKIGYNELAISYGKAVAGSMEAYNFFAGTSITTVHAERERGGTLVASAKTIAKSVFSIAMNITSGLEEEEEEQEGETTSMTGVEIDGMEMMDTEVQSLTNNMNRAMADLKLGSSESRQR
jgi:hypothetical protein